MGNHYLLTETPDGNLSKGMRELNGRYTQAFNRRHRRARFQRLAERAPHKVALDLTAGMGRYAICGCSSLPMALIGCERHVLFNAHWRPLSPKRSCPIFLVE